MKKLFILMFFGLVFIVPSFSQINVDSTFNASDLALLLAGNGVVISNVNATGSFAKFTHGATGNLNIGIEQGVLLTTGSEYSAVPPNDVMNKSFESGLPGHALLDGLGLGTTLDASVLEFDLVPAGNSLRFRFVFGSEEYHEFVGDSFNDVIGFFISGPGITTPYNMAVINGNEPVCVNNINWGFSESCEAPGEGGVNEHLFRDNCDGLITQYDGFTRVLQAISPALIPCGTYHITIAIADVGDRSMDSGVFIGAGSLSSPGGTNFTATANCNGNWSVTATALDPTVLNNRWELWSTAMEGQTTGGVLVSTIFGGLSATFSWLDLSRFYYIRHVSTVCNITETRLVVPDFSGTANASFTLEDVNGTVKNTFCFGEDIYFDGTASFNYDRFYINSRRRPAGSGPNVPFDHHAQYGWTMGNSIGVFNLSQAFENHHLAAFEPGFEYEIQLAVMNPGNCVPWVETRQTFTVVCCDNYLNANFREQLVDNGNGTFSLNVFDFESYGANIVHEWQVYSSQSWNAGPYTLEVQTTTTGPGPIQIFDGGVYGRYYFVVHRLSTACGTLCFGQFVEGTILTFGASSPGGGGECELCGVIDCDFTRELCLVPNHEFAYCTTFPSNGVTFNWSAAQNATQYRLEINLNSPNCCGEGHQSSQIYNINTTYLSLGGMARSCFSWRVGALCNGQIYWTNYHCFRGCEETDGGGTGFGLGATAEGLTTTAAPAQVVQIFPNPANDEINIVLPLETKADCIKIVDLQGRVVYEQRTPEQHLKIDSAKFIAGMYAVRVIYPDGSQMVEHVVINH